MRRIGNIFDFVSLAFSGVITLCMVTLVVLAVVMRYVFNAPLVFSYDLSVILFAWVVFVSLGLAERSGAHLSVDIIDHALPSGVLRYLYIARQIIMAAFCLWFAYLGWRLLSRAGMEIPSMRISIRWLYASFPIGFALLAVAQISRIFDPAPHEPEAGDT